MGAPWEPQASPLEYLRSPLILRGTGSYKRDPVTRRPQLQTLAKDERAGSLGARIIDVVLQLGGRQAKYVDETCVGRGACRGVTFYNTVARLLNAQALINAAAERKEEFGAVIPDARTEGQYLYERAGSAWRRPIEALEIGGKVVILVERPEQRE